MDRDIKVEEIWNKVAHVLLTELSSDEPSPAMVANALRFIKDNAVEGLPVAGTDIDELAKRLPFPKVGVG